MDFASIMQLVIMGLAMGFIYCLVAIEFTLIWNAASLINFSHDKFILLSAYIFGGTMVLGLGLNIILAILLTLIVMALFGFAVAAGIFNPLRHFVSDIYAVFGTIMLGIIIREGIRLIWGPYSFTVQDFLRGTINIGQIVLPTVYIYIIIVSILLIIGQKLLFTKTRTGKAMRCVAQDKEAAALMGINVKKNIAITVALSSVICGIIGILIIPMFSIELNMANMIGGKGFAASVVGGFGTYTGAIVGGLSLGTIEKLFETVGDSIWRDVVAFGILIVFLIIRPKGIIGTGSSDKNQTGKIVKSKKI